MSSIQLCLPGQGTPSNVNCTTVSEFLAEMVRNETMRQLSIIGMNRSSKDAIFLRFNDPRDAQRAADILRNSSEVGPNRCRLALQDTSITQPGQARRTLHLRGVREGKETEERISEKLTPVRMSYRPPNDSLTASLAKKNGSVFPRESYGCQRSAQRLHAVTDCSYVPLISYYR